MIGFSYKFQGIALSGYPESSHQQGLQQFMENCLSKFIYGIPESVPWKLQEFIPCIPESSLGRLQQFVSAKEVSGGHHIVAEDVH